MYIHIFVSLGVDQRWSPFEVDSEADAAEHFGKKLLAPCCLWLILCVDTSKCSWHFIQETEWFPSLYFSCRIPKKDDARIPKMKDCVSLQSYSISGEILGMAHAHICKCLYLTLVDSKSVQSYIKIIEHPTLGFHFVFISIYPVSGHPKTMPPTHTNAINSMKLLCWIHGVTLTKSSGGAACNDDLLIFLQPRERKSLPSVPARILG